MDEETDLDIADDAIETERDIRNASLRQDRSSMRYQPSGSLAGSEGPIISSQENPRYSSNSEGQLGRIQLQAQRSLDDKFRLAEADELADRMDDEWRANLRRVRSFGAASSYDSDVEMDGEGDGDTDEDITFMSQASENALREGAHVDLTQRSRDPVAHVSKATARCSRKELTSISLQAAAPAAAPARSRAGAEEGREEGKGGGEGTLEGGYPSPSPSMSERDPVPRADEEGDPVDLADIPEADPVKGRSINSQDRASTSVWSSISGAISGAIKGVSSLSRRRQRKTTTGIYDVLALQEVFRSPFFPSICNQERLIKLLRSRGGYRHFVRSPVPNLLKGHITDSGLLIASKHPVVESDSFTFSAGVSLDAGAAKGIIFARVKLADESFLDVFNVHLQATHTKSAGKGGSYEDVRARQVAELVRFIRRKTHGVSCPWMLTGDFNVDAIASDMSESSGLALYTAADGVGESDEYRDLVRALAPAGA